MHTTTGLCAGRAFETRPLDISLIFKQMIKLDKMLKKESQAGTKAEQRKNDEGLTSSPACTKPTVICCQSIYATFEHSKIDFSKEISRWKNVIEFNKEGTINYSENNERSISIINVAEVNLQYLLSVSPDLVPK